MTQQDRGFGRLRRVASSLTQSKSELHARDVQGHTQTLGATPIALAAPGEPTTIAGVLRNVTLRPEDRVPAVEAELFDGADRLLVIWLGRRRIRGVEPGRYIVVHGRLTGSPERRTMFNPRYELRPLGTTPS